MRNIKINIVTSCLLVRQTQDCECCPGEMDGLKNIRRLYESVEDN